MQRDSLFARILGIVVFLGGVGLLAFAFFTAYNWFTDPYAGLQIVPGPGSTEPATTSIGTSALRLLIRLALLLIMTIIGSLIAGRGVQIYFAASNQKRPPIYPNEES
jgi:hypothetical protein